MTSPRRTLIIIRGNDRPDNQLPYYEIEEQARKNGLHVLNYYPGLKRFGGEYRLQPPDRLARAALAAMIAATWRALLSAQRFFTDRRLRLWTLLDYIAFSGIIAKEKPIFVYALNHRHSRGAFYSCEDAGVQLLTHQHGDYYHDRGPYRKVEVSDINTCETKLAA